MENRKIVQLIWMAQERPFFWIALADDGTVWASESSVIGGEWRDVSAGFQIPPKFSSSFSSDTPG